MAPAMDSHGSAGPAIADKVNILLVDDQPAKLLSYEVMLQGLGENLIKTRSAQEALEELLRREIGLVLIDVCMPELDGFELAQMIREHPRFERIAIIFVSAIQITDLDHLRGYEYGAVDYVPVPVSPAVLRAKVKVFTELYRKTRELKLLNEQLEARVAERTAELEHANQELERRVEERTAEREAAMAQVHQMQKMESLGQLTGGVAHDFNNLLTVVLANLDMLKRAGPGGRDMADGRWHALLDNAMAAAERGAGLTQRMLAFARRQELRPETVDVRSIGDGLLPMLRRSIGPEIEIVAEFEAELQPVRIDPGQLELALLNLALNARDAMSGGGRLTISARTAAVATGNEFDLAPGRYLLLSIADTGAGMDEATLKRAIEPFFTTKGVGKGTGLGLSLVHGFAVQSGGAMRIASTVGAGTVVELLLPTATPVAAPAPEPVADPADDPQPRRVLVVDDDALVLTTTVFMLESLGHQVVDSMSGADALARLEADAGFDLVITDHAMPGMTGSELARRIREAWPTLPVLLASGYAELPDQAGEALPRIEKPFMPHQMERLIRELLAGRPAVTQAAEPVESVKASNAV